MDGALPLRVDGKKLATAPLGSPLVDRATLPLNVWAGVTVTIEFTWLDGAIESVDGPETAKSGTTTIRVAFVNAEKDSVVSVTVIG